MNKITIKKRIPRLQHILFIFKPNIKLYFTRISFMLIKDASKSKNIFILNIFSRNIKITGIYFSTKRCD
jgi:hypothetical protein